GQPHPADLAARARPGRGGTGAGGRGRPLAAAMTAPADPSTAGLLARLDSEWRHLAHSRATAAVLRSWGTREPALAGWADLDELRAAVHHRADPVRADRLLAALVRLAAVDGHDDRLAARTV